MFVIISCNSPLPPGVTKSDIDKDDVAADDDDAAKEVQTINSFRHKTFRHEDPASSW